MIIKNNNGEFEVNACQYNYLIHNFEFKMINWDVVHKTSFINSTWEYTKADEYFEKNWRQHRNQLK
jgi:hypothetical protein